MKHQLIKAGVRESALRLVVVIYGQRERARRDRERERWGNIEGRWEGEDQGML